MPAGEQVTRGRVKGQERPSARPGKKESPEEAGKAGKEVCGTDPFLFYLDKSVDQEKISTCGWDSVNGHDEASNSSETR